MDLRQHRRRHIQTTQELKNQVKIQPFRRGHRRRRRSRRGIEAWEGVRRSVAHPPAVISWNSPWMPLLTRSPEPDENYSAPLLGAEGNGDVPYHNERTCSSVGQHPDRKQPGQAHSPGIGETFREPPRTLPHMETTRSRPKLLTSSSPSITRPSTTK